MSGVWLPPGKQRFVNPATGAPAASGLVYHYIPGSDTPKDTWEDEAQSVTNQNPIVLDANGECTIWGDGLYRQIFTDSLGVQYWDQVTGFSGSGTGVTFASPAEVAAGLVNDKAVSPFALANSGVLTIPTASPAETLAGITNVKYVTPFALANSGVIPVKANAAEVAALTNDAKFITPKALGDSGVLGGGGSSAIVAVTQFGFIGDGVTDNASHLATMLASTSWDMYVPTGVYFISGTGSTIRGQLKKRFWGPGQFLLADGYVLPGRFSQINAAPSPLSTQGVSGWFAGDTESVEAEWHILGTGVRETTTSQYFLGCVIPHNIWYDVNSGASGMLTRATGALAPGVGSAVVISTDGISPGDVLAVSPFGQDGAVTDTVTVDSIGAGPPSIVFHPNLTTNYPNVVPNGLAPGLATFFKGKRTWAGVEYMKVTTGSAGGGDVYGGIARLISNYVMKSGQIHVFNGQTSGLFGGSMDANTVGTQFTGWENQINDHGHDVAAASFVDSLNRADDTGARSAFWAGHVYQSAGGRPVDTGIVMRGSFRWALDTALASLEDATTNTAIANAGTATATLTTTRGVQIGETLSFCDALGNVVETKTTATVDYVTNIVTFTSNLVGTYPIGRRVVITHGGGGMSLPIGTTAIVFNSTYSNNGRGGDPTGVFGPQYGNVTGDMVFRSGNDGISDFIALQFNRNTPNNARLRLRPDGVQANVSITSAGSVNAAADLTCGAANKMGFGIGTGIYFLSTGGHIYATIDGGGSFGLIR